MRLLIEFAREKTEVEHGTARRRERLAGRARRVEREVTEIDALVSNLLASSRIDFTALTASKLEAIAVGKTALERASVDAARLAAPGDPIEFEGDATLVARAVSNLLENAKRHAGGVEALRIESRPGFVSFVVEDNGPGFDPAKKPAFSSLFTRGPPRIPPKRSRWASGSRWSRRSPKPTGAAYSRRTDRAVALG